jgi:hypothetical protein
MDIEYKGLCSRSTGSGEWQELRAKAFDTFGRLGELHDGFAIGLGHLSPPTTLTTLAA